MSFASEESNGRHTARRKEEEDEEERRATAASSISTYYIPAALSMSDELKVTNRLFADWGQRKCAGQKRNEIMTSCEVGGRRRRCRCDAAASPLYFTSCQLFMQPPQKRAMAMAAGRGGGGIGSDNAWNAAKEGMHFLFIAVVSAASPTHPSCIRR